MNKYITSLMYHNGKRNLYPVIRNGEIKENKGLSTGEIDCYTLNFFEQENDLFSRKIMLEYLKVCKKALTISIDYRLLKDKEILEILRNSEYKHVFRIIGDNYKLTEEDYDNLNHCANVIIVDDCQEHLTNNPKLLLQKNIYKRTFDFEIINGEMEAVNNYFVKDENLKPENIEKLVNTINLYKDTSRLNLRFYNPEKYLEFILKLKQYGLNSDVKISLIGYPLKDDKTSFRVLKDNTLNYEIEILYDTCRDMINNYMNEPFHGNSLYRSELEGGGKTSLDEYIKLLNVLEEIENHIKFKNYSPLEAAIYCQKYLHENYKYDVNLEETDKIDIDTNRKLHSVVNRDTMVCEGYALLYSAMLRRCGIPVFAYSCDRHKQNIMRIKDDKYGIDVITTCDPTLDRGDENFYFEEYLYFMTSPKQLLKSEKPSFITIPISLILSEEDYENYYKESASPHEKKFDMWYGPRGYAHTVLNLMGFDFEETPEAFYNKVKELNNLGYFDNVDMEKVRDAFLHVTLSENPMYRRSPEYTLILKDYFNVYIETRNNLYNNANRILINMPTNREPYEVPVDPIEKNKTM